MGPIIFKIWKVSKKIFVVIWEFINKISVVITIIASIITIFIFWGIQDIQSMLSNPRDNIDLRLDENSISIISNSSATIQGKILIRENIKSAISFLRNTNSEVFPISRTLNPISKWRVQSHPIIQRNGDLSITIDIYCNPTNDSVNSTQVILISCHSNSISEGFEFRDLLPFFESVSNPVTIKTQFKGGHYVKF